MSHSLRRASRLGRPLPPFPRDACLGLLWQNIGSREVANHPFRPTTPVRPTKFSMSSFRRRNGVPARGSKTTKPSGCNTGQRLEKENRMLDAFFSLLGSLARAQIGLAETRHLPSAEATEEGPCKIVLSLERAHRPAQQQNRQEKFDNLAENLHNDGVVITVAHDHQLLEAARSLSTTTVIGPFCFFRLTRDVPTIAASKRIRNSKT